MPTLDPDEAADLVVDALINRPARVATRLGRFGQVVHALAPNLGRIVMNTAFRMFPESAAARGEKEAARRAVGRPDRVHAIAARVCTS